MKNTIAFIDPASYSLPYDFYYLHELSKYYSIDFYCSQTQYNYNYIEELKKNKKIQVIEYSISKKNRAIIIVNYLKLLFKIACTYDTYYKIHFGWSILFLLEFPFFLYFRKKLIITYHNDRPHKIKNKIYKPFQVIHSIASKTIFVSNFACNRFKKNYVIKKEPIVIQHGLLPLHLNHTHFTSSPKRANKLIFFGFIKDYKGVDIFLQSVLDSINIEISGKWDKSLQALKKELSHKKNIHIQDTFLTLEELERLIEQNGIFILPYKKGTQSGVVYTLLFYNKVFITSDTGETSELLRKNNLSKLIFDRDNPQSILDAFTYAQKNYDAIRDKMRVISKDYQWETIMKDIKNAYLA